MQVGAHVSRGDETALIPSAVENPSATLAGRFPSAATAVDQAEHYHLYSTHGTGKKEPMLTPMPCWRPRSATCFPNAISRMPIPKGLNTVMLSASLFSGAVPFRTSARGHLIKSLLPTSCSARWIEVCARQ